MRNKLSILKDRAVMLKAARDFFYTRGVLEVDCPLVSSRASVDAHIDLISVEEGRFLHSSPEYGMKRLLSEGIGDIFQLSHVFRKGELGHKHNPEFMMAEWYRLGFSFDEIIEETLAFIQLFVGNLPSVVMTYREMFLKFASIDVSNVTVDALKKYCRNEHLEWYSEIEQEGVDAFLNLILGGKIEPQLGKDHLFVVTHYPASQAALAKKVMVEGNEVAERFEVYHKGLELANGYHELIDAREQLERLQEGNKIREQLGKEQLPIDTFFIEALKMGLPECCGVAVGFDRCMMLRHEKTVINEVIPFDWNRA